MHMTEKKRGAPPGNKNALKHGFYSRAFTKEEQREWKSAAKNRLQPEINLFKVLIARTASMLKPIGVSHSLPSGHPEIGGIWQLSLWGNTQKSAINS